MLTETLEQYLDAAFSGLWIKTLEQEDAIADIRKVCEKREWPCLVWDIATGLNNDPDQKDPVAILESLPAAAEGDKGAVLVLRNFHRLILPDDSANPELVQHLMRAIERGKRERCFVIILAPRVIIPPEIEPLMVVLDHALPTSGQLLELAKSIATEPGEIPEGEELTRLMDAAAGLTRFEAEGAFALSLVQSGKLESRAIWKLKAESLKKSGLVTLYDGPESFENLGGLEAIKEFARLALGSPKPPRAKPRGIGLVGVPGAGKSAIAKAIGNEFNRPTLLLDVGALMGRFVGQSEEQTRRALVIADAMAPCILFIDEVEKALSGAGGTGATDSGVTQRMFGTFLTWLNDHTSDVFTICTCNKIANMPPEFFRMERFDSVFFIDLPGKEQREAIWSIYEPYFSLESQQRPPDEGWTGAEIRACCRLAAMFGAPLLRAAQNVMPISVGAAEQVESLRREAASKGWLSSEVGGPYNRVAQSAPRRAVKRSL